MLAQSPMRTVKMPELDQDILPAFAPEGVKRILAVCTNVRDSAIILCLLDLAVARAEFVALKVGDIDMSTGVVDVRIGKGRKDRISMLGSKARQGAAKVPLRPYRLPAERAAVVSTSTGDGLTIHGLQQLLKRLGNRSGVENCHPHTFGLSFALWSLRSGINIFALQRLMGHSDLTVLRKYLALVEQDLQDAERQHGAVDHML